MIRDFRNRRLKRLFERGERSKIDSQMVDKVERILARLDVADTPEAMRLPGFRLHELRGNLGGYWSVTVSRNWRIIFRFEGTDVCDVDLVDYH